MINNINKNKSILRNKYLISAFFICLSIVCYIFEKSNLYNYIVLIFKIVLAILGSYEILLLIKGYNGKLLEVLGRFSFQIYLMHTIFSAFIRITLVKLGIYNFFIHLAFGIVFAIGIPIIVSIISNKIIYTNIFIFPQKTIKQLKNKKEIKYGEQEI